MAEQTGYMKPLPVPLKPGELNILKSAAFDVLDVLDVIEEERRAALAGFRERAEAIETRLVEARQQASNLADLLEILDDTDTLDAEKSEALAGFKARAETESLKLSETRKSLKTGTATREVWCVEIVNKERVVEVHRTDVRKNHPDRIVAVREMTLFDAGEQPAPDPAQNEEAWEFSDDERAALADAAEAMAADANKPLPRKHPKVIHRKKPAVKKSAEPKSRRQRSGAKSKRA